MLQSLSLHQFALIENLDISFHQGLNVMTGETGAGKSLLLDALLLCVGGRADSTMVRHGAAFADLYATFEADDEVICQWFKTQGRDFELPILLRRKISEQGRSQAWINGLPASLAELKSLGALLVRIHSQHASLALLKPQYVIDWLDEVAKLTNLSGQVKEAFYHHQRLVDAQAQSLSQMNARIDKMDLLSAKLNDIEPLRLVDMTDVEMRFEELSNFETLVADAVQVCQIMDGEGDMPSVLNSLVRCQKICQNNADTSPIFARTFNEIGNAYENIKDAVRELRYYAENASMDEEEYANLSELVSLAHRLSAKYRMPIQDLLVESNLWQQQLDELNAIADLEILDGEIKKAWNDYVMLARQLHDARQQAVEGICQTLMNHLSMLALPQATCQFNFIEKSPKQYDATGLYEIELLFSANVGMPMQSLHKVASGGELSRIALIMQVMKAGLAGGTPLLVFDEVDVGISGGTAQVVGNLLRQLGNYGQLLVITHQAQVAAAAHQHILVKKQHGKHSQSIFEIITGDRQIHELARMSGGITISDETLAHAKSLLIDVND